MLRPPAGSFRSLRVLAPLLAALVAGPVLADETKEPSADDGRRLAERFCTVCHVVSATADGAVPVGPPPFSVIANKPGQTAEHIKGVLIQPHAPMPDLQLTNDEIQGLLAYLQTLRKDKSAPPFVPPPEPEGPRSSTHG